MGQAVGCGEGGKTLAVVAAGAPALDGEPQVSAPVLGHATDLAAVPRTSPGDERGERLAVVAHYPSLFAAQPQQAGAVFQQGVDLVAGQSIPAGEGGEPGAVEAAQSPFVGGEPEMPAAVLEDVVDDGGGQPVLHAIAVAQALPLSGSGFHGPARSSRQSLPRTGGNGIETQVVVDVVVGADGAKGVAPVPEELPPSGMGQQPVPGRLPFFGR